MFKSGHKAIILWLSLLAMMISCQTESEKGVVEDPARKVKTKGKEGYNGIYKSYKEGRLYTEVTLKNGKKNGLAKKYYTSGELHTEMYYSEDIKVGTSKWYYTNGKVYRETPYKNGKINGTQVKYHKDGSLLATIPYVNGYRKIGLSEIGVQGLAITSYPKIEISTQDYRNTTGRVEVRIQLSNKSTRVKFYQGTLIDSIFDPEKLDYILTEKGIGSLVFLEKEDYSGTDKINIVALYQTRLSNQKIIQGQLVLPSRNLKQ